VLFFLSRCSPFPFPPFKYEGSTLLPSYTGHFLCPSLPHFFFFFKLRVGSFLSIRKRVPIPPRSAPLLFLPRSERIEVHFLSYPPLLLDLASFDLFLFSLFVFYKRKGLFLSHSEISSPLFSPFFFFFFLLEVGASPFPLPLVSGFKQLLLILLLFRLPLFFLSPRLWGNFSSFLPTEYQGNFLSL